MLLKCSLLLPLAVASPDHKSSNARRGNGRQGRRLSKQTTPPPTTTTAKIETPGFDYRELNSVDLSDLGDFGTYENFYDFAEFFSKDPEYLYYTQTTDVTTDKAKLQANGGLNIDGGQEVAAPGPSKAVRQGRGRQAVKWEGAPRKITT